MNIPPTSTNPSNVDPTGTPPAHGANPQLQGNKDTSLEDLQRQLAELQAKNAEFLADNQKYREERRLQNEAAKAAEQQRLKEQGEFKQLAEQSAARVKELEPTVEKYSKLTELVSAQIKAETKDWPKEIKTFDPGDNASVEDRLAWMEKSKPLIEKLTAQARQPGNSPNPKPAGDPTQEELKQKEIQRLRALNKYNV